MFMLVKSRCAHQAVHPNAPSGLTQREPSSILSAVMRLLRHVSAVTLTLALFAGKATLCAGWAATPEERMACCAEGMECPMHASEREKSGTRLVTSQAQADACCAASERQQSESERSVAAVQIATPPVDASFDLTSIAPIVLNERWPEAPPGPTPGTPRHVLFSVFLV